MDNQENIKTYTLDEVNNMMFAAFAKMVKQPLKDLSKNTTSSLSFKKFSKEKIIEYLQSPQKNEKNIRDASVYFFNNSSHYRRLISYYAELPMWSYVVEPYKYDSTKFKKDAVRKQYDKVCQVLENMNLSHEFLKVSEVAFKEDVFYGAVWETTDSFYMQRINPDWCVLSSIEDGIFNYAVDMSMIKEEELQFYPPDFTSMWNEYKKDGIKYKEVPVKTSACFKVNESIIYPLPPFAGTMVGLHDIEDYKSLVKQRTEVGNYKLINMQLPMDKDGNMQMTWDDALKYYKILSDVVPDGVGPVMSPTKLDSITFDKSGGLADADEVYKSEEQFWHSTSTSSVLFGGGNKNSVASLKLSIKTNEMVSLAFATQVERWINRRLKSVAGTIKFKIKILPITSYNQSEMAGLYKDAATLGVPIKSFYGAACGLQPSDISSMCALENDVLNLSDSFVPMKSSYTQSSNDVGRPASSIEDLDDSGVQQIENDNNAAR